MTQVICAMKGERLGVRATAPAGRSDPLLHLRSFPADAKTPGHFRVLRDF